jgi:acyl carrier protein
MNEIRSRLVKCFQLVFPDLSELEITALAQTSVAAWDSVATIMLLNVIEDEFAIQVDLGRLAELNSFDRIEQYLTHEATVV